MTWKKYPRSPDNMIVVYGMSRQAPNMSLVDSTQQSFLGQGPAMINHSEKLEETHRRRGPGHRRKLL